jgi:hypothetical protein
MNCLKHIALLTLLGFNLAAVISLGIGAAAVRNDSSKTADQDKKVLNQVAFKNPRDGQTTDSKQSNEEESSGAAGGGANKPKPERVKARSESKVKAPLFKDFVPSEKIAADQAVDFPSDI